MRKDLSFAGAEKQHYEIRSIISIAEGFAERGVPIISKENIGDPVNKGEAPPDWMKDIIGIPLLSEGMKNLILGAIGNSGLEDEERIREHILKHTNDSSAYGYSPTKGAMAAREFLAERTNSRGGARITPEDILFFNGLGDSISKVYSLLSPSVRVIGPSPAYSTHSSAEASHANSNSITYPLDPYNRWLPDLDDLRKHLKYNDSISGILVINPNNPTGAVYPRDILEGIVDLAEEFDQFLIFDEIYMNLSYNGNDVVPLCEIIRDVPGISMQGISKEWPWPGARCGWIEAYNISSDNVFGTYFNSIYEAKMTEVCATTHPQIVLPEVEKDPRYEAHIRSRNERFRQRAEKAADYLSGIDGVIAHQAEGAFYMTIMFEEGVLDGKQELEIDNNDAREYFRDASRDAALDTRFVYNLIGSKGIITVPLTTFDCPHNGFRVTLLEQDEEKFDWTFRALRESIEEYIG
ncbi:MAG: pyridoxal phosphate-dependent aminotransferase [Candidatus Woesearchaeota archaeon]